MNEGVSEWMKEWKGSFSASQFNSTHFYPIHSNLIQSMHCMIGGGGALLREKMVEVVSDKFICIVDESKLSKVRTRYVSSPMRSVFHPFLISSLLPLHPTDLPFYFTSSVLPSFSFLILPAFFEIYIYLMWQNLKVIIRSHYHILLQF